MNYMHAIYEIVYVLMCTTHTHSQYVTSTGQALVV